MQIVCRVVLEVKLRAKRRFVARKLLSLFPCDKPVIGDLLKNTAMKKLLEGSIAEQYPVESLRARNKCLVF